MVSGGKDRCAILWDLTSGRLVRVISEHDNALLSVSINRLSGNIMTLTRTCVSLHTVNGVLLASALIDRNTPMRNTDYSNIFPATVGMTVPCSYWQDGVELVTGHEGGLVCLWKMKRSRKKLGTTATASTGNSESGYTSPVACLGARSRASSTIIGSESTMSLSLEADSNGDGSGRMPVPKLVSDTYIHRELYVSSTISRVHEDNITALKLCCSATSFAGSSSSFSGASASAVSVPGSAHGYGSLNPTKMKHNKGSNISPQLIENIGSNSDLLVGDAAGYISRWSCHYDQQK